MRPSSRRSVGQVARTGVLASATAAVAACADSTPPTAPTTDASARPRVGSVAIVPDTSNALQAWVAFTVSGADSARVLYRIGTASERSGRRVAVSDSARVPLLALQPGAPVSARVVAFRGTVADTSAPATITASSVVPDVVRRVRLQTTAGSPSAGYVLTALALGDTAYAVAFDTSGRVAWYHAFPGVSSASDAYQQPDGNVTVYLGTSHGYDPAPGYYAEVRPSGELVRGWAAPSGFYTDPHELRVGAGPGGSTYLLGYDYTRMDLQTRGGSADSSVAGHTIFQVDASGGATPVFVARDHFSVADWVDPEPGVGDFDHPNSIDVDRDGGLVVSWRNVDEVSKIDPRTGQFVWRLGGPHNQFTFVNDPLGGFGGQHFARLLADGDLLLYDDGTTHVPQQTRVVEYRLDLTAHTATLVWEFRHQPALFTPFVGSVQRLASGDTFIGYASVYLATEVTPAGAVAWEGTVLVDGAAPTYTAYRFLKIRSLTRPAAP